MADRNGKDPQWISIDAAADCCGLSLSDYVALSKQGVLPAPFQPGLTLIDYETLDRALDRIGCGLEIEPPPLMVDSGPEHADPDHRDLADAPPPANPGRSEIVVLGLIGVPVIAIFLHALLFGSYH